jgi:hypothetical protein
MKVVYGRPGTVLLAAEDEGVEIFYASAMKARVGGRWGDLTPVISRAPSAYRSLSAVVLSFTLPNPVGDFFHVQ